MNILKIIIIIYGVYRIILQSNLHVELFKVAAHADDFNNNY
jgi:hypothetical protein